MVTKVKKYKNGGLIMDKKNLEIFELEQRIATLEKENSDMKIVIKSVGDLAFANNDAIGTISDKFNEFLDRI